MCIRDRCMVYHPPETSSYFRWKPSCPLMPQTRYQCLMQDRPEKFQMNLKKCVDVYKRQKLYYGGLKIMEILECPLYKECKEEECPYFENEDCAYYTCLLYTSRCV